MALVLVAALVLNVMVLPLTVMVSPFAKLEVRESVPAAPDKVVAPDIAAPALLSVTLPVAVLSVLKKLSPASTADAATSDVLASLEIDEVKAVFRFAAVAAGVLPMVKLPVGGGVVLVAVN